MLAEIAEKVVEDANKRLSIFAKAASILNAFNQTPSSSSKDGQYRLFSEINMEVCCEDGKPVWRNDSWDKDGGAEIGPISGTMWLRYRFIENDSNFQVVWTGWGRPNVLVEPGMQWVGYRNDKIRGLSIWHEGTAKVSCDTDNNPIYTLESFLGSSYPSRQVWFNEETKRTVDKGSFSGLWTEHPTRSGYVK